MKNNFEDLPRLWDLGFTVRGVNKERVVQLRNLSAKTEFLLMALDGIDRNHMFQMSEGPLFYNQGQAGKLICFSLIFAYICTFGL